MEYKLKSKARDSRVLADILQNRFTRFDDSVVQWIYRGTKVDTRQLEKKLINCHKNKTFPGSTSPKVMYSDWMEVFDAGLRKLKSINKQPILFFSGGKDSTFIASRLVQNKIPALFYSFVNTNYERKMLNELAQRLKIEIFFTDGKLNHLNLDETLKKIREPVLDPAGLSVLSLLDISVENKISFEDTIFLDGMGNDCYMGHLPGKQELRKLFFQQLLFSSSIHKLIPIEVCNVLGKFGDLLRPNYAAHFPGSTIKLKNYYEQIDYYSKYQKYDDIILQRALQRGIHYDFCSAIAKSIVYVDACSTKSKVFFPFLDDNLIDFYESRKFCDYDYAKLINKLSIRKYLNEILNFDKISPHKGIFKPTYINYQFNKDQINLASDLRIPLNHLNRAQTSDYYLWSKYVVSNNIEM